MTQIQIKVGRDVIWIDDKDVVLDNGSIIQLLTKTKVSGWYQYPLKMSKKLFKDLKDCGFLYTNETLQNQYRRKFCDASASGLTYYKFRINRMAECGYDTREIET